MLASGRGILLMRAFLDDLRFELGGRRAILTLARSSGAEKRRAPRHAVQCPIRVAPMGANGVVDWDATHEAVAQNLSSDGIAILQTPYSAKLRRTWEDEGIDDPATRLEAHGQEDHVRLFGRDIFDLIARAGFEDRVRRHAELLAGVDARDAGVNAEEPFFLFRRI